MIERNFQFSGKSINGYFDADFSIIDDLTDKENTIIITDENIFTRQSQIFSGRKTIVFWLSYL